MISSVQQIAFSYHKKNGYGTVVAGILVAMLIEMIALHALLFLWNTALAWGVTALSLYGMLWLLGDWRAVSLRPILLEKDALTVRIGLRWTAQVPFGTIASVLPIARNTPARKAKQHLDATLLRNPTYLITLKEPMMAQGLYGIQKKITALSLAIDDPEAFEAALQRCFTAWRQRQA